MVDRTVFVRTLSGTPVLKETMRLEDLLAINKQADTKLHFISNTGRVSVRVMDEASRDNSLGGLKSFLAKAQGSLLKDLQFKVVHLPLPQRRLDAANPVRSESKPEEPDPADDRRT